jgi:hypothetical protein
VSFKFWILILSEPVELIRYNMKYPNLKLFVGHVFKNLLKETLRKPSSTKAPDGRVNKKSIMN